MGGYPSGQKGQGFEARDSRHTVATLAMTGVRLEMGAGYPVKILDFTIKPFLFI